MEGETVQERKNEERGELSMLLEVNNEVSARAVSQS